MKKTQCLFALTLALGISVSAMPSGWALVPQAREYYLKAQKAERLGQLDEAEQALRKAVALDPQDYLNFVKLAAILNQQGKPNEAVSYYQRALNLNPQDVMILYSLGSIYEQLGQYDKAEEAYALTLQNNPHYRFGLLNLARVEIQQQKYEPAIAHYQQFLTRYPDHFTARRHLARLFLVTGREADSVQQYEVLKQRFPGQFGDHLDMARALNGANEPEKALEELKTAYAKEGSKADINEEMARAHAALRQTDLAILHYQKAYGLNPKKEELLLRIGDLYRQQQKPSPAIENYQAYLKLHPDNHAVRNVLANTYLDDKRFSAAISELTTLLQTTTDPKQRYALQKDRAYATQMTGDLPRAIMLYEVLLPEEPAQKDLQLRSNLAIAYHKTGNYRKAATLYKQIYHADAEVLAEYELDRKTIGNDLAVTLVALGDAAYKSQDFDTALAQYAEATLYANQENYYPYLGLGNAYYAMHMPEKALEAYNTVLAKDPGNVTARLFHTKLVMADPQKPASETAMAAHLATLEKLAKENPDNLEVLVTLADAYAHQGNATAAIPVYEKALALQPGNVDLLLAIGSQWQALGNFEQAKSTYQRALAVNNQLPMLHYNLGIVYNELGQLDKSVAAYQQAIKLDPSHLDAQYGLAITLEKQQKYQDALETYQTYTQNPSVRYYQEAISRIEALRQALNLPKAQPAGNSPKPTTEPAVSQPLAPVQQIPARIEPNAAETSQSDEPMEPLISPAP